MHKATNYFSILLHHHSNVAVISEQQPLQLNSTESHWLLSGFSFSRIINHVPKINILVKSNSIIVSKERLQSLSWESVERSWCFTLHYKKKYHSPSKLATGSLKYIWYAMSTFGNVSTVPALQLCNWLRAARGGQFAGEIILIYAKTGPSSLQVLVEGPQKNAHHTTLELQYFGIIELDHSTITIKRLNNWLTVIMCFF